MGCLLCRASREIEGETGEGGEGKEESEGITFTLRLLVGSTRAQAIVDRRRELSPNLTWNYLGSPREFDLPFDNPGDRWENKKGLQRERNLGFGSLWMR